MSIILWSLITGDYLRTLLNHQGAIVSLEFSEDNVLLASGSGDDTAIVWDVASGGVLHVLGPHEGCDRVLAFSEDYRHLTTGTSEDIFTCGT
jgi:WD40 repeat protein